MSKIQNQEQLNNVRVLPIEAREILISFNDGSYKKVKHIEWAHKQWIHFTKVNGKQVHVNHRNVNYMEEL